jgi:hypothetical protein
MPGRRVIVPRKNCRFPREASAKDRPPDVDGFLGIDFLDERFVRTVGHGVAASAAALSCILRCKLGEIRASHNILSDIGK